MPAWYVGRRRSQDGLVKTEIQKQSVPLDEIDGHIFTIHIQGLDRFRLVRGDESLASTKKRAFARFSFDDPGVDSLKIVGRVFTESTLRRRFPSGTLPGTTTLVDTDGSKTTAILWSAPQSRPGSSRILLISALSLPRLDQHRESSLLFVGGFERLAQMSDVSKAVSFLALSYPAEDPVTLKARLGTIDFERSA